MTPGAIPGSNEQGFFQTSGHFFRKIRKFQLNVQRYEGIPSLQFFSRRFHSWPARNNPPEGLLFPKETSGGKFC